MKTYRFLLLSLLLAVMLMSGACTSASQTPVSPLKLSEALANGKPTLAEFGRGTCIPCQEMKPILEDIAFLYEGKLNVVSVQIDDEIELARQNKITLIPTQICYDSSGKEVMRHVGTWPREQITAQLDSLGVK